MALQPGLEPGTCGLTVRRSTDWAIGESEAHFRDENESGQAYSIENHFKCFNIGQSSVFCECVD